MLTVVVPSYNESGNIEPLTKQIAEALDGIDYELLFVDDSTDETPEVIKKEIEKDQRVRLIHRENEKGLATAVLRGFEDAGGDILACMDADLQHPPMILRAMYAAIMSGADMCIPSRYLPGGDDGGLNYYRKFVSWTARKMGQVSLPPLDKLSDPTSGLFMLRKECIEDARLRPIGWKIMIEVVAMGNFDRIVEIPYRFSDRASGESKLSADATRAYLKQVRELRGRYNVYNNFKVERWPLAKMMKAAAEI